MKISSPLSLHEVMSAVSGKKHFERELRQKYLFRNRKEIHFPKVVVDK